MQDSFCVKFLRGCGYSVSTTELCREPQEAPPQPRALSLAVLGIQLIMGTVFVLFRVRNEFFHYSILLRLTCIKQYESCFLLRMVWNFAHVRDEKQNVFRCEWGQGLLMHNGMWPLKILVWEQLLWWCSNYSCNRKKNLQAFDSRWRNSSNRRDQREMT